ncbi:MAG: hypothetical protein KBS43_05005 [Oscillospiraceae bacterium]|nr:hypothetical protein [Candidatus Limimonas coprohippi]
MNVNRILKIAIVIVLTVAITLCIPGTFAKYSDNKNFTIVVDLSPTLYKNAATSMGESNCKTVDFNVEHDGYYAIVIRGGNGANGLVLPGNQDSNGSLGGYVYSCVYLKAGDKMTVYIGNAGENPSRDSSQIGSNGTQMSLGGKSSNANNVAGGSGGSATVVKVNQSIISIAAGGGGGGSCNAALGTVFAYKGAKGGNGGNISSSSAKSSGYIVFDGNSGESEKYFGKQHSGTGGSTSGGNGGDSGQGTAGKGTVINISALSGGSGGAGKGSGAGGGGGYAGGGGGSGNGNLSRAGGGGGGSSAIILTSGGKNTLKLKSSALSTVFSLAGYSADFSSYSGGFAIVAYLNDGSDTSQYSDGTF